MQTLNQYLHATRTSIAFMSETKCNTDKATARIARLPLPNFEIVPSCGKSGGLWLLWSNDVRITTLELSFILCLYVWKQLVDHGFWALCIMIPTTL